MVKIGGRRMYLWRAVDDEGEVLDVLVQKRRKKHAALKLLRKLLKNQGIHPETITTDKLASYRAAVRHLGSPVVTDQAACARITALRTPTWSSDDESGNSKNSSPRAQPSVSSQSTARSTTPSTCSPTSSVDPRFGGSGPRRIMPGRLPLPQLDHWSVRAVHDLGALS